LLEIGECAAREQISYLPGDSRSQRFFQSRAHQVRHALRSLERDIADKSVRHDYVDSAAVDITAFNVADEIQRELLEKLERFAGELVAFAFFCADRKQSDTRPFRSKHAAEIDIAHDRELLKILGFAV